MKRKIMKNGVIGLLALAVLFIGVGAAFATNMSANAGCDNLNVTLTGGTVKNSDNSTLLPVGCVLQYIYAGPDNTISPPDASGNPTGDDVLITSKTVGSDTVYATFTGQAGMFYHTFTGSYSSGTPQVYVRAWNASSIASATDYGNSALFTPTLSSPPSPNSVDCGIATFATTIGKPTGGPVPTVTGVSPNTGINTTTTPITITGTNFTGATAMKLWNTQSGSITLSYTVNNATSISATVPAGLSTYTYDVTVTTANGTSAINAADQFTVTGVIPPSAPTVTGISPNSGANTSATPITITGTNFTGTTSIALQGAMMNLTGFTVNSATSISVTVPAGITLGTYDILVTTPNGTSAANANDRFTVTAIITITPPTGAHWESAGGIMMAYPNPFNPNDKANPLKMLIGGNAGDTVSVYIFDANGRIIYQDKQAETDVHTIVTWDGQSSYGGTVDNGIYLVMIVNNGKLIAKGKILVVKK